MASSIASHSGVRALVDNTRNLGNDELDAIARTGGAVCIVGYSSYLRNFSAKEQAPINDVMARFGGLANGYEGLSAEQKEALYRAIEEAAPRARMEDYVAAIDYAVKRVGIDHVCLSSDFNHVFGAVQGWTDESETRNVTEALRRRGYDAGALGKL
jgi:membrane dipeptidase